MRSFISWLVSAVLISTTLVQSPVAAAPKAAAVAEPSAVPAAHWIWASQARDTSRTCFFRTVFDVDRGTAETVKHAEFAVAADFNHMRVYLNGQRIADVEDYDPQVRVDVTRHIKPGRNLLAVRSDSSDGPSAVAMRLNVVFQNGTAKTVVSDTNWLALSTNAGATDPTGWLEPNFNAIGWQPAAAFGELADDAWGDSGNGVGIREVDDYTQWKQALGSDAGTDPSSFVVLDGFQIELLKSAGEDEGSWVSLAFDPKGRLTIAREDKGLLRLTFPKKDGGTIAVETINDTLLECRGLLYAWGVLYANANNSKGLYRLRDTNGDDQFDEVKLLYASGGNVGHGRNDLALGPDGMIYSIHGDAVDLPAEGSVFDATSPFREHRRGSKTREGHVYRIVHGGTKMQILAGGLRNPYGIDFNTDGELFTYDADAEHDMGAPWYRPTRVVHLVSGADYGWRGVTGSWPPYYPDHPDNGRPNLDIGKGSPTGVKFGTRSNFPPKYQRALFILDWAYGRIMAIRMTPKGASYACRGETFVKGRPFNVTDLGFGPDGAMYVVTGGRKTQSALYRIRYIGPKVQEPPPSIQLAARTAHATKARALRHRLEGAHSKQPAELGQDRAAVIFAWPHLASPDPWIRHAARIGIEHQPIELWQQRTLDENQPVAALTAMMALVRGCPEATLPKILAKLNGMPIAGFTAGQKLTALHIYAICLQRIGTFETETAARVVAKLDPLYPDVSVPVDRARLVNQELSKLLVKLDAPSVVAKTMTLLGAADDQKETLHYLFVLRNVKHGWTIEQRWAYFDAFRATATFQGGDGMPKFIQRIKAESVATLTPDERKELASVIDDTRQQPKSTTDTTIKRPLVKDWQVADLVDALPQVGSGRNFENGKAMFVVATCIRCHRMGREGTPIGPDLSGVARRFGRRDLLESTINPSKVVAEKYRNDVVVTTAGRTLVGRIVPQFDFRSPDLLIATDPLRPDKITKLPKTEIESYLKSQVSLMPKGLLNSLTKSDILDLLAYIEAAGQRPLKSSAPPPSVKTADTSPLDQRPQPWQRRDKPILSATTTAQSWSKVVVYTPFVLHRDGKFQMWYLGTSTGSRSEDMALGYARSDDGINWTEHAANPILTRDDVPWEKSSIQTPFVMFDTDEKIYKMWFVTVPKIERDKRGGIQDLQQRLAYATSSDGIKWKVHPKPLFWSGRSPSVMKAAPNRYRMWMGSKPTPDHAWGELYKHIYEFTSADGIDWKRGDQPVITPTGDARSTVYPFVIRERGTYYMWYGCHVPGGKFELFCSTSRDGSKWNVNNAQPAFAAADDKQRFDGRYTSTPCVVNLKDRYLLYYSARDWKRTYTDSQGRQRTDGSGVYAHIGVAVIKKTPPHGIQKSE